MRIPGGYPKKVYVRGDVYHIKFVRGLKNLGETDGDKYTIKLRGGMGKSETFKVFIHEILHALEFSHKIKIKHDTIYELEDAIFQLMIDNFE